MEQHEELTLREYRTARSRRPSSKANDATFLFVLGTVLVLALLLVGADLAFTAGRIHPGVSVGGVDVGGLKRADAGKLLKTRLDKVVSEPISLTYGKKSWRIEADRVGARADAEKAVDAAYSVGREGPFHSRLGARLGSWFKPRELPLPVTLDETRTAGLLRDLDSRIGREPSDAGVEVKGTEVSLVPAKDGARVKRDVALAGIVRAFASADERTFELQLESVAPAVSDSDAETALEDAEKMLSGPVTLTHSKREWTFEAEDVAAWIAFRKPSADGSSAAEPAKLEAYIDADEVSATIRPIAESVGREPRDARFIAAAGNVTIVPSQVGTTVDVKALARTLSRELRAEGDRRVPLRLKQLQPKITTDKARGMGIKERISTYTTEFSPGNKPRVNNIHTLAKALDGTLIAPGGTFSFNGTIGPRTAEAGYQEAPAIVNGKLVPQLGGGVCQVGTTIFNAVYESGLPVVERRNHSFYISHYPKGRDATVSWGGPDFKFKNSTSSWILVRADYSASSVTISLYGTDPGYTVSSQVGPWTDTKPFPVREVKDPAMPEGSRIVEDAGITGRRIVVTRIVKKDGQIVDRDEFTSVYRPKEQVVRVGTKRVSSDEKTETSQR